MLSVFLGEGFQHARGLRNVLRILVPVDGAAAPAVVPAILAARRTVQIQQQLQAVTLAGIQRKIDVVRAFDKGSLRFERPIADRATGRRSSS